MLVSLSTATGSLGAGEVVELEGSLAKRWVAQGVAEPFEDEAPGLENKDEGPSLQNKETAAPKPKAKSKAKAKAKK
jgi:hypothetical protein